MAKEIKSQYKVIGVMAGSSMDGLDIAEVSFTINDRWTYKILRSSSVSYSPEIHQLLIDSTSKGLEEQKKIDIQFGEWIANKLLDFKLDDIDLIAVHGHTIVHAPHKAISWQLGNGKRIAELTNHTIISDFRSLDVSLGGEGAPLVPIGDFLLLSDYDACLNLGGIANVSIQSNKTAWDICPCNQVLNYFAKHLGKEYDEDGHLARNGEINESWKLAVASNSYFKLDPPKSLPNNFISEETLNAINPEDGLSSYTSFLSEIISDEISRHLIPGSKVLATGGGAHNNFLIELLNENSNGLKFHVPEPELVDFKEAVVFGLIGVLKVRNEVNVLASVTGASGDTSSGIIHSPK